MDNKSVNKWKTTWGLIGWVWMDVVIVNILAAVIGNMFSGGFIIWLSYVGTPVSLVLSLVFTIGILIKTYLSNR